MDAEETLVIVGVLLLLGLVVLIAWIGVRLLLLPLRVLIRYCARLTESVGVFEITAIALATAALLPNPFVYFWRWFVALGRGILLELPRAASAGLPNAVTACRDQSAEICGGGLLTLANTLWFAAVGRPIETFDVPDQTFAALMCFVSGVVLVKVFRLPSTDAPSSSGAVLAIRTVLALAASFVFALYLSIAAIVAIPVFGDKVPEIKPLREKLASELVIAENTAIFPEVAALKKRRDAFKLDVKDGSFASTLLATPLDFWDRSFTDLVRAAEAIGPAAREFGDEALRFFQQSNEGYVGELPAQRHSTLVANEYKRWVADYRLNVEGCTSQLSRFLQSVERFSALEAELRRSSPAADVDVRVLEAYRGQLGDYRIDCYNFKPLTSEYRPTRVGPTETLGWFGSAAGWLLKTESRELALIVGLLGFGFFGALAASFIREFAATRDNELPTAGFIIPAFIRGVGAAILVFLLAKGGVAVFVDGDSKPNAYVVFFACFVAAVFSDDVWSWARSRQRGQLAIAGKESGDAQAPVAAKTGPAKPSAAPAAAPGGRQPTLPPEN